MLRRRNGLFSYGKKVSGCWKASNLLVSCVPSITVEPIACEEVSALEECDEVNLDAMLQSKNGCTALFVRNCMHFY